MREGDSLSSRSADARTSASSTVITMRASPSAGVVGFEDGYVDLAVLLEQHPHRHADPHVVRARQLTMFVVKRSPSCSGNSTMAIT